MAATGPAARDAVLCSRALAPAENPPSDVDATNAGRKDPPALAVHPSYCPVSERAMSSGVLGANGDGQALAALRPTTLQNVPAASGGHASAKAVRPLPLDVAWLVCALHRSLRRTLQPEVWTTSER